MKDISMSVTPDLVLSLGEGKTLDRLTTLALSSYKCEADYLLPYSSDIGAVWDEWRELCDSSCWPNDRNYDPCTRQDFLYNLKHVISHRNQGNNVQMIDMLDAGPTEYSKAIVLTWLTMLWDKALLVKNGETYE
jgi:hypothetical protein